MLPHAALDAFTMQSQLQGHIAGLWSTACPAEAPGPFYFLVCFCLFVCFGQACIGRLNCSSLGPEFAFPFVQLPKVSLSPLFQPVTSL